MNEILEAGWADKPSEKTAIIAVATKRIMRFIIFKYSENPSIAKAREMIKTTQNFGELKNIL